MIIEKKCYFVPLDEFITTVKALFGDYEEFDIEFDGCEGIYFCGVSNEEVYERVTKYLCITFGLNETFTKVHSIHTDHFEYTGVWVVLE